MKTITIGVGRADEPKKTTRQRKPTSLSRIVDGIWKSTGPRASLAPRAAVYHHDELTDYSDLSSCPEVRAAGEILP